MLFTVVFFSCSVAYFGLYALIIAAVLVPL